MATPLHVIAVCGEEVYKYKQGFYMTLGDLNANQEKNYKFYLMCWFRSIKYNWHAVRKARNLLRSPENCSGVGTHGSGGNITVGGGAAWAGAGLVGGLVGVARDCTRSSS